MDSPALDSVLWLKFKKKGWGRNVWINTLLCFASWRFTAHISTDTLSCPVAKTPIYLFSPNRIDHKSQRDTDREAHRMPVFNGVEDHGIPPGGPPPVASSNPVRWNPTTDSPPGNFCHIPSGRTQQECPMHTAGMLRDRGQAISLSQQRFSCCAGSSV